MIRLVLASASPRRRALLEALGVEMDVHVSHVEERSEGVPEEVALGNAAAKRDDVSRRLDRPALVVAADTIVVIGGRILGKPSDLEEAAAMLRTLSGATHRVITGIALENTESGDTAGGVETTEVTFRELSAENIDRFVEAVAPLDRAGAYTVDGPGSLLVARYDGCYQNVLGLPIVRLDRLLNEIGDGLFPRVRPDAARFL